MKLYLTLGFLALLHQSNGQKMYKTKFRECGGRDRSDLILEQNRARQPIEEAAVTMSAPYDRKAKKHVLFKTARVKICIKATIPLNTTLPLPINRVGLKNA